MAEEENLQPKKGSVTIDTSHKDTETNSDNDNNQQQEPQKTAPDNQKSQPEDDGPQSSPEELLAGKYKNEDELKKGIENLLNKNYGSLEDAYKALEKSQGNQQGDTSEDSSEKLTAQSDKSEENSEDNQKDTKEEKQEGTKEKKAENKIDDWSKYTKEYRENGELSKESLEELEENGVSKNIAQDVVDGLVSKQESYVNNVYEFAGGKENYQQLIKWMENNVSKDEIETFNSMVQSNNLKQAKLAIQGMKSIQEQDNPSLLQGKPATGHSGDIYNNYSELMEDMKNPKYKTDEKFARQVQKKIARTPNKNLQPF